MCFNRMTRKRRSPSSTTSVEVLVVEEESPALAQDDHADEVEDLHNPTGDEDDGTADVPTDLYDENEGEYVDSFQSNKVHSQETNTYEAIIEDCGPAGASRKERCDAGSHYVMNKDYETRSVFLDRSESFVRRRLKVSPKTKNERTKSASYENFETFCAMQDEETEFGKATYIGRNYVPSTQEVLGLLRSGAPVTCGGILETRQEKNNTKSSPTVDERNEEYKTSGYYSQRYLILLAMFVVLLPLCLFLALPMYFTPTHDSHMQKYIEAQREGRWADIPLEYRNEVITKSGKRYSKHLLKPDDPRWALDVTYAEMKQRNREDESDVKLPPRLKRGAGKTTELQRNEAGIAVFQKIYGIVQLITATASRGLALIINIIMETAARIRQGAEAVVGASCGGVTGFITNRYRTDSQVFKFVMKNMKEYWRRGYNGDQKIIKLVLCGIKMFFQDAHPMEL